MKRLLLCIILVAAVVSAQNAVKLLTTQTVTDPALTSVGITAVTLLPANSNRRQYSVVNIGTTVVFITLGSTNPSATVYHYPLKGCTTPHDGTGGFVISDIWRGDVRAIGSAAGGSVAVSEIR